MTGILVVNHFLNGDKFDLLHSHLVESAKAMGIDLIVRSNQDMIFSKEDADFVLFWDKDVALAKSLENNGYKVFNSASAIELCDDKAKTYLALENIVNQPKTLIPPLSFFDVDYSEFVDFAIAELGLPLVFKERFGSFGEQVHLCHSKEDVMSLASSKSFLLQKYVKTAEIGSEDIRLEVVGGKVVAGMKRVNKHDFRSNITNGGTAEPYSPTEDEKQLVINTCKALDLDFGGVDIMMGDVVCEVNSNAHIINIMQATGIDVAKEIFGYIIEKI